ncbi:MAG: winged helix-turn-helix domain-containing protein [Hyphomicrobiaceae bacterium]
MTDLIVRIDLGSHGRIGPGKLILLEKIDELGSISAAGRAMNMSYRQAWGLVDQMNRAFKEPVVASKTGGNTGGGAHLTEFGKLLLAHCRSLIASTRRAAKPHLDFLDAVVVKAEGAEVEGRELAASAPAGKQRKRAAHSSQ